jgi:uncharacterized protein
MTDDVKPPKGFARLSPERRKEISALGGRASHLQGKAHEFTSEEARAASKKARRRKKASS